VLDGLHLAWNLSCWNMWFEGGSSYRWSSYVRRKWQTLPCSDKGSSRVWSQDGSKSRWSPKGLFVL